MISDLEWWQRLLQAVCILGIFSFLYRENKVYRFFEHILLGLGVGVGVAATWVGILKPKWWDRLPASPIKYMKLAI